MGNRWEYPYLFAVNPYNSQNMGKANSHSKDKIWKTKTFKIQQFLKYMKQKQIQKFPNHGMSKFP